ncbi:AMP-binding protein [Streptomyces sp. NPDC047014]|uniref:AMP-binding protein n=1 Tax=Streptomyces sp. NPDC047014 TaxID=3155736 RepID=UPI0033E871F5
MNATPDRPELDELSADLAGLLGRIGLGPHGGGPREEDRLDSAFAAVAASCPGRIAARDTEDEVAYLELEWLADEIARRLSGRAGPGSAVGVRAARSCRMAGAVVGVLRAGAAVLPLEPAHTAGLQEFLMRTAGAGWVVSDCGLLRDEIPVAKAGRFVLASRPRSAGTAAGVGAGTAFLALPAAGDPGRAAGVGEVSHAQVLAWARESVRLVEAGAGDVWSFFHSLSLDVGMRELWGPLLSGGCAVVVDREVCADADAFAGLLAGEEVTVAVQLPSAFARLAAVAGAGRLPALRHVLLAGEAVDPAVVGRWREAGIAPRAVVWDAAPFPPAV